MNILAQAAADASSSDGTSFWLGIATIGVTIVGWLVTFLTVLHQARARDKAERQLVGQQGDIDARLRTLEASLAVRSHVQIVHSEYEIQIYHLLWERVESVVGLADFIPRAGDERRPEAFDQLQTTLVDLERTVNLNQPFYSDEVCRACRALLHRTELLQLVDRAPEGFRLEDVEAIFDDIEEFGDRIFNAIRRRNAQIAGLPEPEDIPIFAALAPNPSELRQRLGDTNQASGF